ncbi:MAG: type II secretion system protein [bacterium]|nr:type II secretion system protein [bacterium]
MNPTSFKKGFTLIELLVVIAIIGLLSSIIFASLTTARMKGRDAVRLSGMNEIQKALELYYANHGKYPDTIYGTEGALGCSGWDIGYFNSSDTFIPQLVTDGIFTKTPGDPTTTGCNGYYYFRYVAASWYPANGCQNKSFYVLGIRNLEATTGIYPNNPGWDCTIQHWNTGSFEWFTGKYED